MASFYHVGAQWSNHSTVKPSIQTGRCSHYKFKMANDVVLHIRLLKIKRGRVKLESQENIRKTTKKDLGF